MELILNSRRHIRFHNTSKLAVDDEYVPYVEDILDFTILPNDIAIDKQ